MTVWLTFILSESNHRLSPLRAWTAARWQTGQAGLGVPLVETDVTDDRLAQALDYLHDPTGWGKVADLLNRHTLRSYDWDTPRVRLDRTTAQSYGQVTEEGVWQCGHSKEQRPDLPQLQITVSTLDPLGLPLTTTLPRGAKADAPLYVPESDRGRQTWPRRGRLDGGDRKMAALQTRVQVAGGGDYSLCPLPQRQVAALLKTHRVAALLPVQYPVRRPEQPVRAYGDRPARVRVTAEPTGRVQSNRPAGAEAQGALGWRVYATNAPRAQWSLTTAVLAYRGSYLIERGCHRLKGQPLSLTPLSLTTPGRLTGLVRVLLMGLRGLGLIEYQARRELAKRGEKIAGLTKGLPKKATARPTTAALLPAFDGITLTRIGQQWYLPPLSELQRRILALIGFTAEIYHCLIPRFSETQIKMGETSAYTSRYAEIPPRSALPPVQKGGVGGFQG